MGVYYVNMSKGLIGYHSETKLLGLQYATVNMVYMNLFSLTQP